MNLLENIKEGLRAIQGNLLRTVLTALIVAIGIMSLVGILTAVDGIKHSIDQTFSSLGANSFDIKAKGYSNRRHQGGLSEKVYPPISYFQARQYQRYYGDKARISISTNITGSAIVKYNNIKTNPNFQVKGGDEFYLANENYNFELGRPFSTFELENGTDVCIIGYELKNTLFKNANPLAKRISFLGKHFKVIGVLERSGSSMGGRGSDRLILIPLETANNLPRDRELTYNIKTSVPNAETLNYMLGEATGVMRKVRQDKPGTEDSFEITRSDSVLKSLDSISGGMKMGGFLVGFITLLGASIGLMNIMMVSVTERTREIGIRKALGATSLQIRQQFLIEAIVICLLGGILGIILGLLMGNMVAGFIGEGGFIVPWLWVMVGLIICVSVGLISGWYPAFKASKLDPIESLRYE
ncbi:ABC transporter permease [Adhaeribacter sp. BT258]|uniref:ABC transporter permease n=1 Tax=Adhaeribacter terrigena TaxID=2793070 RepID=A0ABS1C0P1_9BACT|nr:ABC transporter permease [Adhaeribacter terrigena]MBK0402969.1 ABC transporter permease [Adhaeribacter terrigena]